MREMGVDESVTIGCGLRYALGRSSYAPGCIIDHIKANKSRFMAKNIAVFKRDILEYIDEHVDTPYKQEWLELVDYLDK